MKNYIIESLMEKYKLTESIDTEINTIIKEWKSGNGISKNGRTVLQDNGFKIGDYAKYIEYPDTGNRVWYSRDYKPGTDFYKYLTSSNMSESLILEKVNHENDEINEIIRRNLGKKPNRISKADMQALTDAGITVKDENTMVGANGRNIRRYGRTETYGPSHTINRTKTSWGQKRPGRQINQWDSSAKAFNQDYPESRGVENFDKVDLKGYLDKAPAHNEWKTQAEIDAKLRPYSNEYKDAKLWRDSAEREADYYNQHVRSDDDIEADIQKYRDKLISDNDYFKGRVTSSEDRVKKEQSRIDDIKARAKARHTKNESLNEDFDDNLKNISFSVVVKVPEDVNDYDEIALILKDALGYYFDFEDDGDYDIVLDKVVFNREL